MGLIDLKTDLKSLKYGKDELGGGDSGQPYIKTDINTVDSGFNRLRLTKFDDGLIRGGIIGATNASVVDTIRIGKFLTDIPKGPLFIVKQIGLQLSNPRLEVKQVSIGGNNSTGILGFVNKAINTINSNFGPTRIYNLGINTLAQVPVNAFGQHFNRHGLLPVQDDQTKYFAVVNDNNKDDKNSIKNERSNRLLRLKDKLLNSPGDISNQTLNTVLKSLTSDQLSIADYLGGPGSVYGIGRTIIRRYGDGNTEDVNKIIPAFNKSTQVAKLTKINYEKTLRLSLEYSDEEIKNNINSDPTIKPTQVDQNVIKYTAGSTTAQKYATLKNDIKKLKSYTHRNFKSNPDIKIDRESKTFKYNKATETNFNRVDSEILQIVFRIQNPFVNSEAGEQINFSAYMNGFKDDFSSTWNEINYAGRAESFYVYDKYKRTVSFNLQIPCFNKVQLFEKHRALGQLASVTAGSYGSGNFLGGVLIKLNVGKYIVGEYAILDSLSYSIPENATWDYDERLAMNLDASFQFKIIHKDLPQYKPNNDKGFFNYLPNLAPLFIQERRRNNTSNQTARNFAEN
jgi:hypothetical protein